MSTPKKITLNKINNLFITPEPTTFLPFNPNIQKINPTTLIQHKKICLLK
jgi:hypothetical protein